MPDQIDYAYNTQRRRILSLTAAQANRLWAAGGYNERDTFLQQVVAVVEAGQRQTVSLLSAYMTHKARTVGDPKLPYLALNPDDYTIEKLRGVAADVVYARPFGTIGARMAEGADFQAAAATAGSYVTKLASTDVQLAQTYGARDWISQANDSASSDGAQRIVGYNRVTGGECCDFCELAAEQTYHIADLLPIHEGCTCGVEPIYGDASGFHSGEGAGVTADDELGARLQ